MRATYCGLMSEIDDQLGRVFDYLKQTGQWDDTLIVFTCDHGEQLGDHHLLGKIGYFDESYRIPMIIRDPRAGGERHARHDRRRASPRPSTPCRPSSNGSACRCRASATAARCCRSARASAPADWRTEVHYEFDFRDLHYSKPESALGVPMDKCSLAVVQDENYKYVHFAALPPLFFDLEEGSRPVREPRRRSGLCRAHGRICRQDAELAAGFRRTHADRLPRHAARGWRCAPPRVGCRLAP